jgi:hypothetical protein
MPAGDWGLVSTPSWLNVPDFWSLRLSTLRKPPELRGLSPGDRRSLDLPDCVADAAVAANSSQASKTTDREVTGNCRLQALNSERRAAASHEKLALAREFPARRNREFSRRRSGNFKSGTANNLICAGNE